MFYFLLYCPGLLSLAQHKELNTLKEPYILSVGDFIHGCHFSYNNLQEHHS
jgi:hypothetical protein